ncbi:MAG: acyl carrier protein [Planctomycetales bacterium]|nr:acyl carrier protein [Planctomycetales bacterium]MCA9168085.1 acyl carrier protein [Planctomycetales bacterium]
MSSAEKCPRCGFANVAAQQMMDEFKQRASEQLKIPASTIGAQTLLLELPVDSLGLVEFVTELERDHNVSLLEQAWSEDVTCGDIVRIVLQSKNPRQD